MDRLGWLSEYSEPALRSALRVAGAGLDRLPIELTGTNDLSRPTWASGTATVDRRFLAKFAFSEPTAVRVWHEALLRTRPGIAARAGRCARRRTRPVSRNLHAPQILALARERLDDPLRIPEPGLQATTNELRLRFTPMIKARQREHVRRCCDWVDEQLAAPAEAVFVHGDFHPDNQLRDPRELRLLLVVDFETSGAAAAPKLSPLLSEVKSASRAMEVRRRRSE